MNIYDLRRYGKIIFIAVSAAMAVAFLYVSNKIVEEIAAQERDRMEIWADATRRIASIASDEAADVPADIDFLFDIIRRNTTIPILLTNGDGEIIDFRNFDLPEPTDPENPSQLSPANRKYLEDKLAELSSGRNVIIINITDAEKQYLYYEDSHLLKQLSYFPYLELIAMLAFITVGYFALSSTKRAEQNKVWVGLTKETAHQLGTPISSLMAWIEYLRSINFEPEVVDEMNKDVERLSTIASRFSKVGSAPTLERGNLNDVVAGATSYMERRISSRISLTTALCSEPLEVDMSVPLLEWVMENLIKNAVDAMDGTGKITIVTSKVDNKAVVDITDTGKGISRKHQKTIFNPGFTTKKRGWGLGLALARRIVDQYHRGHIFVLHSEPGHGTTFRITLPMA